MSVVEEVIIERAIEGAMDLMGIIDPVEGLGIGIVVGFVMGWVSRSSSYYRFNRKKGD